MKFSRFRTVSLFAALIGALATAGVTAVSAQSPAEQWIQFNNFRDLFDVRMLSNNKSNMLKMNIGGGDMAASAEVTGYVAGTEEKPGKTYSVQAYQTLGSTLDVFERRQLLERNIEAYIARFKPFKGEVLRHTDITDESGFNDIAELYMAYHDPKYGPLEVMTRIYVTGNGKMIQTAVGPEEIMNTYRTRDFFKTIKHVQLNPKTGKTLQEEWPAHRSPLHIFTAYLPEPNKYYVPGKPRFQSSDKSEAMIFRFYDPMLEKSLAFNLYAYRFGSPLNEDAVKEILARRHLQSNRLNLGPGSFKVPDEMKNTVQVLFQAVPSPRNYQSPYGLVRGTYSGNYLLVYEMFGPDTLLDSALANELLLSVDFHPQKAIEQRKTAHPGEEYTDEDPPEGFEGIEEDQVPGSEPEGEPESQSE